MSSSTLPLQDLHITLFESRMQLPLTRLFEKQGAHVLAAPALKEIPLAHNTQTFDFYEQLQKGEVDYLVLMTGVGTRTLIAILEEKFSKEEILNTLSTKTKIVVRGPKPRAVCALHKIPMAHIAPEPNTWRDILSVLDAQTDIKNKKVVVLEYGMTQTDFIQGLQKRGALVQTLRVYNWSLPDDLAPVHQAIDHVLQNKTDALVFTTQIQVEHLLELVKQRNVELPFRRALHKILIASIGPVTTEKLAEHQLFVDLEATPNKNDALVDIVATKAKEVLINKRNRANTSQVWIDFPNLSAEQNPTPASSTLFLKACRREPVDRPPLWLMRQAGRYMAEYHLSRGGPDFLAFCKNSDRAAEATLTAIERLGVDAAIIFADILLPLEPMGLELSYKPGIGPVIANPIRTKQDLERLKKVDVSSSLNYVATACKKVRSHLDPSRSLIGFCGAPFTMAAYAIQGSSPKQSVVVKKFMYEEPHAFDELLNQLVEVSINYLQSQIDAGCDVVQIFDSWVGDLSPVEYRSFVLPHSKTLIENIKKNNPKVPVIHFGTSTGNLLCDMQKAGGDVIGIDAHTDLITAWNQLGPSVAVQGNLDPLLLFADKKIVLAQTERILKSVANRPGFIFNLGHGIAPETPVDTVMAMVDFVKNWRAN